MKRGTNLVLAGMPALFASTILAWSDPLGDPPREAGQEISLDAQPRPIDGASFVASRKQIGQFASTIDGDHEDAGILTSGGGPYGGVVASHVVYTPAEFNLTFPAGAKGTQTLFAPTTRAPNGSCLEVGTAYESRAGTPTNVTVYVFDFCAGLKFKRQTPVNQNFLDNYTTVTPDGLHAYTTSIVTNSPDPIQSDNWTASLFNVKSKKWDVLYSDTGQYRDLRGWTIFETWFQKGQCSKSLPNLVAFDISYRNMATGKWEVVQPQMSNLTVNEHDGKSSDVTNTNCFNDDKTGPASYRLEVIHPDSAWKIVSTGH
ncbi:hypothetical protein [Mesorhizobium sp.]|uniref:hypothetical protein n=1 Tax=Mesorhizobium sp. TaxID=1871066 RepID=UPI000FEA42C3|nr:hypothetical protein [Mesorhizobium sp.]RWD94248.1 MAG: hypothetical protein EOS39_08655 [Mesorhizobium sp.]